MCAHPGPAPWLSIVMPVLDEAERIGPVLLALQPLRRQGAELIVCDGGSRDDTLQHCTGQADLILKAPRGRARQMNAGAAQARGGLLLFLHADTRLPDGAMQALRALAPPTFAERPQGASAGAVTEGLPGAGVGGGGRSGHENERGERGERGTQELGAWGRFDVRIDGRSRGLSMVAAAMNLRSRLTGIATGDQAIFVERRLFDAVGGFPDQPLMEDIEISRRLKRQVAPTCLRLQVRTCGRRWDRGGLWPTIGLMWRLRWLYWLGADPARLARLYR